MSANDERLLDLDEVIRGAEHRLSRGWEDMPLGCSAMKTILQLARRAKAAEAERGAAREALVALEGLDWRWGGTSAPGDSRVDTQAIAAATARLRKALGMPPAGAGGGAG